MKRKKTMNAGSASMRRWRMEHGLTQQALANMVGIDLFYLSKIERGARRPGRVVAVRIAEATDHAVGVEMWGLVREV